MTNIHIQQADHLTKARRQSRLAEAAAHRQVRALRGPTSVGTPVPRRRRRRLGVAMGLALTTAAGGTAIAVAAADAPPPAIHPVEGSVAGGGGANVR